MGIEDKSAIYDVKRCQLVANGVPTLNLAVNPVGPKEIEISGFTTLETTVDEAKGRSDEMLKVVFQQLRKGNHQALVDLLDEHPQFIAVPRIRNELTKWVATRRSYRRPGRPRKGALRHPLVVAVIVDELASGEFGMNKGDAFEWVADHLCISASTARDHYYNAKNQARFKPLLMQTDPQTTTRVDINLEQLLETAELLEPGNPVIGTLDETANREISVSFNARLTNNE